MVSEICERCFLWFNVESRPTIIDEGSNQLCLWPFRPRVEFFGIFVPSALIRDGNLCKVIFQNSLVEVDNELVEPIRRKYEEMQGERTPLTTSGIWEKAACCAMCCCIAMSVDSSI